MNEWIGLIGVVLGSLISGVVSYLANKRNHKNNLEAQQQLYKLENKKLYAKKQEELMSEYLEILSLTVVIEESFKEGLPSTTAKNKINNLRDASILKARLYFPQVVNALHSFLLAQSDYINSLEHGSQNYINSCAKKYISARDSYLEMLSEPLSQKLLLDNP